MEHATELRAWVRSVLCRPGRAMKSRRQSNNPTLFQDVADRAQPLAARMRPATLDEFVGQEHLLAPGKPLRESIEQGTIGSIVLWGPPGSGKTTLGRLIASYSEREFVPFSSVTEGDRKSTRLNSSH